jgi:type 1 glutamine amidotransferase
MASRLLTTALLSLLMFAAPAQAGAPKRLLLLCQGPDGHPPETHEYVAGLKVLHKCLEGVPGLEIKTARADEPWREGPELLDWADGVVLYLAEGAKWMQQSAARWDALNRLAARKGGLVVLHWAMGTREAKNIDGCLKLLGGCHGGPDRKYQFLTTNVTVADRQHPIATGVGDLKVRDEFYYRLKFVKAGPGVQPILRAAIDGEQETVAWAWERPDGGRSFGFSGLHYHDNWSLVEYRRLVAQAVLWTLRLPIPKDGLAVKVTAKDLQLK